MSERTFKPFYHLFSPIQAYIHICKCVRRVKAKKNKQVICKTKSTKLISNQDQKEDVQNNT